MVLKDDLDAVSEVAGAADIADVPDAADGWASLACKTGCCHAKNTSCWLHRSLQHFLSLVLLVNGLRHADDSITVTHSGRLQIRGGNQRHDCSKVMHIPCANSWLETSLSFQVARNKPPVMQQTGSKKYRFPNLTFVTWVRAMDWKFPCIYTFFCVLLDVVSWVPRWNNYI